MYEPGDCRVSYIVVKVSVIACHARSGRENYPQESNAKMNVKRLERRGEGGGKTLLIGRKLDIHMSPS